MGEHAVYHSALGPAIASERLDNFELGDSRAFVHDLMSGPLPQIYNECDLVYADLAWMNGFKKFNRRAGVKDDRRYKDYMETVAQILNNRSWAAIMVTGAHAQKHLPEANHTIPIKLNGPTVVAYCYDHPETRYVPEFWPDRDAEVILGYIASLPQHETIGDFCCGYGRTGRAAHYHGKRWILSDINAGCIGMIARHVHHWPTKAQEASS